MYTNLNLQLVCTECPKDMDEQKCPVRKYIANEPELFNQSVNENVILLAKPYDKARWKYECALMNITELCKQCKGKQL